MIYRLKFMILFVAVLGLFSCSKDDAPDSSTPATTGNIAGTWEVTGLTYNGTSSMSQGGQTITTNYDAVGLEFNNSTVTFNSDGTFQSAGNGIVVEMTMTFMGQTITQEMSAPGFLSEGTYSINGSAMTVVNANGTTQDCTIEELTATTLHLSGHKNTTVNGGQVDLNYDMVFTKM